MGTVPVVPVFAAGTIATGAEMQQLATAIAWCLTGRPLARLQQQSAQTFTNGSFTAVTWDTKIVDRDSGWSSGSNTRYTAQTPGFYACAANIAWATSSSGLRGQYFQVTTGANNPLGAGVTAQFGFTTQQAVGTAGTCATAISPYLYDLDYVEVYAYQNSGGNLATSVSGTTGVFYTVEHVSG